MKEKTQDLSRYSCEDHIYTNLYDSFLCEYQKDIKKIIGKYRKAYHKLSPEDLFSEANLYLVKYKKKILSTFNKETPLTQAEFKKIAFHYVKNCINWSHSREYNEKDNLNRVDQIHNTEEGVKTTFELAVETSGKEDDPIDDAHDLNLKRFMHVLLNYSYLLTESETKILSYIEKGLNQDAISEKLGVTRQAVSHSFVQMKEKLNSQFKFENILNNDVSNDVPNGLEAINSLLEPSRKKMTKSDKDKVKDFLLKHPPKKYSYRDINEKLFDSKYLGSQISGCVRVFKLQHLISYNRDVFNADLKEEITKFFKNGLSSKEISEIVGINYKTIASFRGSLVCKGILNRVTPARVFPKDASDLILNLHAQGASAEEIQSSLKKLNPEYNFRTRSIACRIAAFNRFNPC